MQQPPTYRSWIGVGVGLGSVTVAALAAAFALGTPLTGAPLAENLAYVVVAALIGGFYGMIGGLVAGLVCAVVSRALATRDIDGPTVQGVIAAGVVALIATPTWISMWPTSSWRAFVVYVVLPLTAAVLVSYFGGRLVWARRTDLPNAAPR